MDVSAPSNEPSLGYFALSKNARAASLVPPPEGKPDTDLGLASEAQPRTLPDDGLPQNDKEAAMAASPSVAAFIDATGRERAIQSLTPQPDNAASNPDRAASAPVESTADSKAKPRDLVHTEEGHRYTDISKAQDAAPEAGSDPVLCDSPKEQERTAPLAQAESSTTNIIQPPGLGTRFRSREEFKNACQNHALSLSAADPSQRFHFATRTSALGKWLMFSCHQHIKGCPVAVRVELDKSDQSWVVTSANYDHSHISYATSATTQPDVSAATFPRKKKTSRRFSIIRKKLDAPPTSFSRSREASAALTDGTDGETTDSSSITAVRRKPRARRAHSDTGVAHRPQKTRHLVADGDARAAFLKQQKRSLHRLSTPPAQPQLDSIAASPRIKSDRERGTSLQHNTSHSRACSEGLDADVEDQPPSPTDSVGSGYMGRPRSYSVIPSDRNQSHLAIPNLDPFMQNSSRLFSGWGSAPRRSPSPEPFSRNMSLGEYLGTLHNILSDLQEPFRRAGVSDVSMLLSLEREELDNVVDSFAGDQASSLQRMLAKNRIGRALL